MLLSPYSRTQMSYDAADRLVCTAVRMNPSTFASALDPCETGTAGANGEDRITRLTYDAAGQVTVETRAYDTALAQAYLTNTYTANGRRETLTDANGNRSTFVYDGFDRVSRLRFPNATLGAGTSSTTDYEEYGYDANGNRTSFRRRSGDTIGYTFDALNRETVKDIPGGSGADVYSRYDLLGRRVFARFAGPAARGSAGRMIQAAGC